MEALLAEAPLHVLGAESVRGGLSHARRLTVELGPGGPRVRIKWKRATHGGDGHNRSPRHELATWALAELLFGPEDQLVPPTALRCFSAAEHAAIFGDRVRPTFHGADCVLGTVSLWLEDVSALPGLDADRYAHDVAYRTAISNLNLLTYAMDHRDAKNSNFVINRAPLPVRVWSIDNGVAFSGFRSVRAWFHYDWSHLLVPSLPSRTVRRLDQIRPADLRRLAVLAQFEVRDGKLVPVPPTAPIDPELGVRRRGNVIQVGLTREEIDGVQRRLERVRAELADGSLATFEGTTPATSHAGAVRHRW
jgi:hypothetical protein